MKLIFLHGIGDGDPAVRWLDTLNQTLTVGGHPIVQPDDFVAPRYARILNLDGLSAKMPPPTADQSRSSHRREYERRQGKVVRLLDLDPTVEVLGFNRVPTGLMEAAQAVGVEHGPGRLKQVRRYVQSESTRGAVLTQILAEIPQQGDVVIVGHSLGSVIAIDLIGHLPENLRVTHFITLGSPASSEALHRGSDRLVRRFPYSRVGTWSNFYSPLDVVTGGQGLGAKFAGAQDFVLTGGHGTDNYLANSAVGTLIADGLRPPSQHVVRASTKVTTRLSDENASLILMLHFAEAVRTNIKDGDVQARYTDALHIVKDDIANQFITEDAAGQPLPKELRTLVDGKTPSLPQRWEIDDAIDQLIVLSLTNLVAPFEIDVAEAPRKALEDLAVELGFSRTTGETIGRSIADVKKHIESSDEIPWGRVLTAAAGLSLIALGPIGLVVAAPAGVAGAAALTGGLAALGPGGMVGGLATLGGLAGTGAAMTTAAATSLGNNADLQTDSTRLLVRVAADHARKKLDLPVESDLWFLLGQAESHLAAMINRWIAFSDDDAPTLAARRAELGIIRRLIEFMRENRMAPESVVEAPPEARKSGLGRFRTRDELKS